MFAEALVLGSEITLAAYPILIKQVPTNLWTQVVSRMGVYGLMGFLAILLKEPNQFAKIQPMQMGGAGLLNLLHVGTSYKAFKDLPAGNAMAIFYAYPIWNLLGAWLLLGETIPMDSLPWVGLALAGMVMIAQPDVGTLLDTKHPFALLCAVLSGVTESAIYFYFKRLRNEFFRFFVNAMLLMFEFVEINLLGKWVPHKISELNLNQRLTVCISLPSR